MKKKYIVYRFKDSGDGYGCICVPITATVPQIHIAIAKFENNESLSKRKWSNPIKKPRFNFIQISENDLDQLISDDVRGQEGTKPQYAIYIAKKVYGLTYVIPSLMATNGQSRHGHLSLSSIQKILKEQREAAKAAKKPRFFKRFGLS